MVSLLEVFVKLIVRMMVLLFWITYNRCSGHLMLLPKSFHKSWKGNPLMMVLRVSMLLNRYRMTLVLRYMLD
jgi:hypothetical protein